MEKEMVIKRFMYYFVWISFLFIFLSNYIEPKATCLGLIQAKKGVIKGLITDDEGNPLPGVTVTLTSDTGISQTTITGGNGQFRFINLPPRSYDVRAELQGFRTEKRSNIYVSVGSSVSINISLAMGDIDETGGIPDITIQPVRPPDTTTGQPFNLPHLDIPQVTLHDNIGLNPFTRRRVPMNTAECYYSSGRIYGINGIARVGQREERLNNITQFPYGDERYTQNSSKVERGCVYAIRVGDRSNWKTLLIRVLEVFRDRIEIEYWIQNER